MKAQFVYEKLGFERGQDPKDAMQLGHWGIKKALLAQPQSKVDTMEGDNEREWWETGGIPTQFKEEIGYNDSDPLAFTDFVGFDEDYYMEEELPEWVDQDEFLGEFKPTGPKKAMPNTRGWGTFQYQRGGLPDGSIVYHYVDGMGSGFLTRRDWLKSDK